MAKKADDTVLDAPLAEIATSTAQNICSAEPANFAGIAAVSLGNITITAGLGGGDWGAAVNGTPDGRATTMAQQSGTASATGTANHVTYDQGTILKAVTTCPAKAVTNTEPYDVLAHTFTFRDPT